MSSTDTNTTLILYLVAMNDGTDEIFNLQPHAIAIRPGESGFGAWQRWLAENWAEWEGEDSFEDEGQYRDWRSGQEWLVSLVDLTEYVETNNANEGSAKIYFEGATWVRFEKVGSVLEGLRMALGG